MFHLRNKFSQKSGVDFIVAGLGNPGSRYEGTRHNVGFAAVDYISQKNGAAFTKIKFEGLSCTCDFAGTKVLLVKPQTYMNESGRCIGQFLRFYKLPPERLIVLSDDISLSPGKIRIRREGSDGGHNGLKSIILHANSQEFPRIKIGVGERPHPEMDLADWVLSKFGKQEQALLSDVYERCGNAVELMIDGKIDQAMNLYN